MKFVYTVIIPHKNIPELLLRCINSIPERDDLQIIVVDDNSSPAIVDFSVMRSIRRNNFLFIETKEGKGAGYARNVALYHVDSKWVLFADADDYFSNNVNQFLEDYKDSDSDIIFMPNETIDAITNKNLDVDQKVSELLKECDVRNNNYDALRFRSHAPWTKMIKVSLIKKYGISFQEVPASNDVWFSIQVGYYAKKIDVCNYTVYIRTVRKGSLQYSLNKNLLLSRINVGYKVNRFLKSIGKIEYYNETWGYLMDLCKIDKLFFIYQMIIYLFRTPFFVYVKHLKYLFNRIIYKIKRRCLKFFLNKMSYMYWEDNEVLKRRVFPKYSNIYENKSKENKQIIFIADGSFIHGGLSDRLRGIISLFKFAIEYNLDFRIYWTFPFNLSDYLSPNEYNWLIKKEDICYNLNYSLPIYLGSYYKRLNLCKIKEEIFQQKKIKKIIESNKHICQYHFYTNAHFSDDEYSKLFNILFKPSPYLQEILDYHYKKCDNGNYMAMSFRFRQLLGDFMDACGGEKLDACSREKLILESLDLVKNTYLKYKNDVTKIFVTSDSNIFINSVKKIPFVYVVEGEIKHVDNSINKKNNGYDKEFVDMLLLSKAKMIFRCKKDFMYLSGFPKNAAQIGYKKLVTINY